MNDGLMPGQLMLPCCRYSLQVTQSSMLPPSKSKSTGCLGGRTVVLSFSRLADESAGGVGSNAAEGGERGLQRLRQKELRTMQV